MKWCKLQELVSPDGMAILSVHTQDDIKYQVSWAAGYGLTTTLSFNAYKDVLNFIKALSTADGWNWIPDQIELSVLESMSK